jgi:hypothetical protein
MKNDFDSRTLPNLLRLATLTGFFIDAPFLSPLLARCDISGHSRWPPFALIAIIRRSSTIAVFAPMATRMIELTSFVAWSPKFSDPGKAGSHLKLRHHLSH